MKTIPIDLKHITAHRPYHDIGKWLKGNWHWLLIICYFLMVRYS